MFLLIPAAMLLSALSCRKDMPENKSAEAPLKSIVILYDNDVHCSINGYACLAGLRNQIQAPDTAYVGVVSSGDYLSGAVVGFLTRGEGVLRVIDKVGYDAMAPGNHEFDYYSERLFRLSEEHKLPMTCLNLTTMAGKRIYPSYILKQYGPKKVAFVGVLTPQTLQDERYAFYDDEDVQILDLHKDDLAERTQQAIDDARSKGADYVVLLAHLGESSDGFITSHELVSATTGVDIVLDGHTHSVIPCDYVADKEGKQVPVTQTGTGFQNIGKLLIRKDGRLSCELIPTATVQSVDTAVRAAIARVEEELAERCSEVVGESEVPLLITDGNGHRMVRKAETSAGDFIRDALRFVLGSEIAVVNGGSIRDDCPSGALTFGAINNVFPFLSYLWEIEASGDDILAVLEYATRRSPDEEDGDFPHLSGLRCTIREGSPRSYYVQVQQADGTWADLVPSARYKVATIDYCVRDGGFNRLWAGCTVLRKLELLYCDAAIDYIKRGLGGHVGSQYAAPQGRLVFQQ
ncbi:MAG: bifunctional metallophosphatase/5'-nucleotidase [Bacteroidales bacterium]|nr:bifunctional metallophosphatase/5'-nucleotidase [Bacteroidales bacterium]